MIRPPDKKVHDKWLSQILTPNTFYRHLVTHFSSVILPAAWQHSKRWLVGFQTTSFWKLDMVDMYLELSIILLSIIAVLVVLILYIVRQTLALNREYDVQMKKKIDEENLWIDRRESDNNILDISWVVKC